MTTSANVYFNMLKKEEEEEEEEEEEKFKLSEMLSYRYINSKYI